MEHIQSAVERYKQQQKSQPGGARTGSGVVARTVPPPIVYCRTRSVDIPESVLRKRRLLTGFEQGPFMDGYKILRTQVTHRLRENGWNVLGVTSPNESEGKTLTAVNLAIGLAMDANQTVLLVDADLQHPGVETVFEFEPCAGLTDYLYDDRPIEDLLIHPGIGRCVVLTAGRPIQHSSEALTSPKMAALVHEVKHRYASRVIVFDLPPLLNRADALAFTPYTDALLLVVEEGKTTVADVEQALGLVKNAVPVLGTVLNKAGRLGMTARHAKMLLSS